jgi:predicted RNA-binding Zn ribbon-like protein
VIEHGRLVDLLHDFNDLISWLVQAGVVDVAQAKEALKRWGGKPEGERAFAQAQALRAKLRRMVERVVAGKAVEQSAIEAVNAALRERFGYPQLIRTRGGFEKRFHSEFREAHHLIVPLAESAADLLCYGDLSLLKRCENPACVLYFYDTTKNHARRWCSMSACGNRMKVAAYYQRQRV